MDDSVRSTLAEVQLFVKSGAHQWVLHESVPPNSAFFTCKAPADGEYQFTLVTVDKIGKRLPSDIEGQPPSLRVVVDTAAPTLEISGSIENGSPFLHVKMIDANPDLPSIQALASTSEGDQRALAPVAGRPGTFALTMADLALLVRVAGSDLAGNQSSREITPRDLIAAAANWNTAKSVAPAKTSTAVLPPASPINVVNAGYRPTLQNPSDVPPAPVFKREPSEPRLEIPMPQSLVPAAAPPSRFDPPAGLTEDNKKAATDRDDLRAQLVAALRERDDLNAKLTERTNEVIELRVQLGIKAQERQQLTRELQQFPREVQSLLLRLESSLQPPASAAPAAPAIAPPGVMPRP